MEALSLHSWLRDSPGPLRDLIDRAEHLAELNHAMRKWTQEPWLDSVRIVNVRGDTVVMFATSAAALLPLRFQQQAFLAWLRTELKLACTKIEIKVKPTTSHF